MGEGEDRREEGSRGDETREKETRREEGRGAEERTGRKVTLTGQTGPGWAAAMVTSSFCFPLIDTLCP